MCDHINGVLVASGVDEQGEWQSLECEDCGKTWVERRSNMKVNGYEIGEEPTRDEWRIYEKVKAFGQRETAAQYLGDCGRLARPVSQQAFEEFVATFAELEMEMGEEEGINLEIAWDDCFGISAWDE